MSLNENWDSDVRADMSDALDGIVKEDKVSFFFFLSLFSFFFASVGSFEKIRADWDDYLCGEETEIRN